MKKQESRSYPLSKMPAVDRELFAPVDPIVKANQRGFVVLLGVIALTLFSLGGNAYQFYLSQVLPVRVLSINDAGQADSFSLQLSGFTLHKAETQAALRHSISDWMDAFSSRLRNPLNGEIATRAFQRSLLFLSNDLSSAYQREENLKHDVARFMSSVDPEYRVVVTTINFRNLEKKPYEADLYYDRIYYSQPLIISARKSFLRTIRFTVNPADDEVQKLKQRSGVDLETLLKVNPLVLAITQVGDEQTFGTSQPAPQ